MSTIGDSGTIGLWKTIPAEALSLLMSEGKDDKAIFFFFFFTFLRQLRNDCVCKPIRSAIFFPKWNYTIVRTFRSRKNWKIAKNTRNRSDGCVACWCYELPAHLIYYFYSVFSPIFLCSGDEMIIICNRCTRGSTHAAAPTGKEKGEE